MRGKTKTINTSFTTIKYYLVVFIGFYFFIEHNHNFYNCLCQDDFKKPSVISCLSNITKNICLLNIHICIVCLNYVGFFCCVFFTCMYKVCTLFSFFLTIVDDTDVYGNICINLGQIHIILFFNSLISTYY